MSKTWKNRFEQVFAVPELEYVNGSSCDDLMGTGDMSLDKEVFETLRSLRSTSDDYSEIRIKRDKQRREARRAHDKWLSNFEYKK